MDLISREAVLDRIDKYIDKAQSTGTKDDFISFAELGVKALPSPFEGMTNGEVMKAVFPKISVFENIDVRYPYMDVFYPNESDMPIHSYKKDWWNAPYKAESEDKE